MVLSNVQIIVFTFSYSPYFYIYLIRRHATKSQVNFFTRIICTNRKINICYCLFSLPPPLNSRNPKGSFAALFTHTVTSNRSFIYPLCTMRSRFDSKNYLIIIVKRKTDSFIFPIQNYKMKRLFCFVFGLFV